MPTDQRRDAREDLPLAREGLTMALYVAVCLVAALAALPEAAGDHLPVLALVWGVPLGLALAHLVAFRVAARLGTRRGGRLDRHDAAAAGAQLAGAVVVALLGTVVVLLTPGPVERVVVSGVLAGAIGLAGYLIVRSGGETRGRAAAYGVAVAVVALGVVVVKNALAGH